MNPLPFISPNILKRIHCWIAILFLGLFVFGGMVTAQAETEKLGKAAGEYNILLITVDCLRPDHMGIYGYHRNTTPGMDAYFSEAAKFENAFSQASWTSPGIISLLTGWIPSVHGMDAKGKHFDPNFKTALKQLQSLGYKTFGYDTSHNYANQGWTGPLAKGKLIETLEELREDRFFIWTHHRGPHLPYNPPEPYRSAFGPAQTALTPKNLKLITGQEKIPRDSTEFSPDEAQAVRDLYDGEVLHQDHQLKGLFDYLKSSGLDENTIVILTADHGEELLEHGFVGHASTSLQATVFDEVVRIPLLIRVPSKTYGRVTAMVQQIDLMPTLFEWLGVTPEFSPQGRSRVKELESPSDDPDETVFFETTYCGWQCLEAGKLDRIHSVRTRKWKLVEERRGGEVAHSLYDLANDPGETRNVADDRPDVRDALKSRLHEYQTNNMILAEEWARQIVYDHMQAGDAFKSKKDLESAKREWELGLHLVKIYSLENPSLMDHLPGRGFWQSLVRKFQTRLESLK